MLTKVDQNITKNLTILFLVVCLRAFQGRTQKNDIENSVGVKSKISLFFYFSRIPVFSPKIVSLKQMGMTFLYR